MKETQLSKRNATVAVIGAGDYIGGEIAKKFAAEGFSVFAGRRNGAKRGSDDDLRSDARNGCDERDGSDTHWRRDRDTVRSDNNASYPGGRHYSDHASDGRGDGSGDDGADCRGNSNRDRSADGSADRSADRSGNERANRDFNGGRVRHATDAGSAHERPAQAPAGASRLGREKN